MSSLSSGTTARFLFKLNLRLPIFFILLFFFNALVGVVEHHEETRRGRVRQHRNKEACTLSVNMTLPGCNTPDLPVKGPRGLAVLFITPWIPSTELVVTLMPSTLRTRTAGLARLSTMGTFIFSRKRHFTLFRQLDISLSE